MANCCVAPKEMFERPTIREPGAFTRLDESEDYEFYEEDRFEHHLDKIARETVEDLIGKLIVEEKPEILDLMAGWDSHIPEKIDAVKVTGLGLNANELAANPDLTEYVVHNLNTDPVLPFPDNSFDVVLNTVSVDYMTRPVEVFWEVSRVLKPGGLFLVIFTNRFFTRKAVKVWRESTEDERLALVEDYFWESGGFGERQVFVSKGRPRPADDPHAWTGLPSDPIYAIYAEKPGAPAERQVRPKVVPPPACIDPEELARRMRSIKDTLSCPHCGERMSKWVAPETAFGQTWDYPYMYVCYNDRCDYFVRGWDVMSRQMVGSTSYRCMYIPEKDRCVPMPVPSPMAGRECIIEEC